MNCGTPIHTLSGVPDWLALVVLTTLFTPARSSLTSIYLFPLPAVRFWLA